jgi:hypothetical protein
MRVLARPAVGSNKGGTAAAVVVVVVVIGWISTEPTAKRVGASATSHCVLLGMG